MKLSAEQTLHAPNGTLLVDFTPGRGVGYRMDGFSEWTMPCGEYRDGRLYVDAGGALGSGPFASEIGHPAGTDLLLAGWPIMLLAAERDDLSTYTLWERRLGRVAREYSSRPPDLDWVRCNVTPYVSDNPGYHWSRIAASFAFAYLGLSGYGIEPWHDQQGAQAPSQRSTDG
jgi:hypothetical protein